MNRYDPKKDPNVRLVGKKLPGVSLGEGIPALDEMKQALGKRTGGLDITMPQFHVPMVIPVEDVDKIWGLCCLGCSIEANQPVLPCTRFKFTEMFSEWPEVPVLRELARDEAHRVLLGEDTEPPAEA